MADSGDKAEVHGVDRGGLGRFGHDPANEIVEQQLSVGLLNDTSWRVGAQVLNVQRVFPFPLDGLDLPAAMV